MTLQRDPRPYDGPIERLDGRRPFNMYLWPTEQWVFYRDHPRPHVDFAMRVEIIALADGRFATEGFVWDIERELDDGLRCVFDDRDAAIRASAARMIRLCRSMVRDDWKRTGVTSENAQAIIEWARAVAARETGRPEPRAIAISLQAPAPPPRKTGLPLFDFGVQP